MFVVSQSFLLIQMNISTLTFIILNLRCKKKIVIKFANSFMYLESSFVQQTIKYS